MVAWLDDRTGHDAPEVVVARVALDGTPLDPVGIVAALDVEDVYAIDVAYGAGQFMVVYTKLSYDGWQRGAVRFNQDGALLDIEPIQVSDEAGDSKVVFVDSTFIVSWYSWRRKALVAARIDTDGRLLDPSPLTLLASADGIPYWSAAAGNGDTVVFVGRFNTAQEDVTSLMATTFRPRGAVIGTPKTLVADAGEKGGPPSIASDGTDYMVSYVEKRGQNRRLVAGKLAADASSMGNATLDVHEDLWSSGDLSYDGTSFVAAWEQEGDVLCRRISSDERLLESEPVVLLGQSADEYTRPVLAASNGRSLVAAVGPIADSSGRGPLTGMIIDESLEVVAPPRVWSLSAPSHVRLQLGTDGESFLSLLGGGSSDWLRARRLDAGGRHSSEFSVVSNYKLYTPQDVNLGFDQDHYLAVWRDSRGPLASSRLQPNGAPLDYPGIPIEASAAASSTSGVSMAKRGSEHLVVWGQSETPSGLFGVLLGSDAVPLSAEPKRIMLADWRTRHSIASDGLGYLLAWDHDGDDGISVSLLSADGAPIHPEGIRLSAEGSRACCPSAAFNGRHYLVAWGQETTGNDEVSMARISAAGVVLDTTSITLAAANSEAFRVARYGTSFLVLWAQNDTPGNWRIVAALVDSDGIVTGPAILDDDLPFPPRGFRAIEGPQGRLLIGYVRFDPNAKYGAERARTRLMVWNAATGCPADAR